MPDDPGWCPRCLALPAEAPVRVSPFAQLPGPLVPRLVSSTRPGALSFGWFGRLVTSLLLLFFVWFAYGHLMPFFVLQVFGVAGALLYVAFVSPFVVYALWRIWRPARIG